jgi:histidine triad (HIT) family protein
MTIVEQIISRELEAVIVYESEDVIAFADHDPISIGHILIAPKHPYKTFIEIPEIVLAEIFSVAKIIYKRLEITFKPDGLSFIQNNGIFNELDHYHLHIFPRYANDKFKWITPNSGPYPIERLRKDLAEFISNTL